MPTYKEGDERSYFPALIAGLLIIAFALASFIYSLVTGRALSDVSEKLDVRDEDGLILVDPNRVAFPQGEPNLALPGNPPL